MMPDPRKKLRQLEVKARFCISNKFFLYCTKEYQDQLSANNPRPTILSNLCRYAEDSLEAQILPKQNYSTNQIPNHGLT
ncbi:hypothetical protein DSUL_50060 [Desulfovibrionales bacterium]